jgi:hypothetical protein
MNEETTKLTNPKDRIGAGKLPLHLWPETASALGALALCDGMLKYGRTNWRVAGVRASIYVDAARRHLGFWFEGENNDPDSGLPHLAHALACIAILVDAEAAGHLNDDRQVRGGYRAQMTALVPHVKRLLELHADKSPKHYTIADNKGCPHVGCTQPEGHLHTIGGPVQNDMVPRHGCIRPSYGAPGAAHALRNGGSPK